MTEWEAEFERCTPWIEDALHYSGGTHKIGDIRRMVGERRLVLWPGKRSAVVTEFVVYPQCVALNFFLAGGDLDELSEMEPVIAAWAKQCGCARITLVGRRGWTRSFLTDRGYEPKWVVLAKEI
ncbi:MAG: hypothetical protein VB131_01570 [Burkholderia gladioli]